MEDLSKIVVCINDIYNTLQELTNDELRKRMCRIEEQIGKNEDKQAVLDFYLPEAFAIIKDTARRLSLGNVCVAANNNDRLLAEKYDFVKVEGEMAIYLNTWDVEGESFTWNMIHYDEQLMGGILLHQGYAVEMATGEGKTLVATLPVLLNALAHKSVHLMTVNDYLSKRDCELTRPIYMFHGLSVECIEYYNRPDKRRKEAYKADVIFGTNSSFTFDYLFDHLEIDAQKCVQHNHYFAVIDELDSILIDDAATPHIVGGGNYYNEGKIYKKYIDIVKELLENESLYTVDYLKRKAEITAKGKSWLEQKTNIPNLYNVQHIYEINNYEKLSDKEKTDLNKRIHLQNVFNQFLYAFKLYECDVDYIVEGQKVKIIDPNTGRVKENNRWEHGLHTAIEVKEGVEPESDFDGLAVISLKNYFKLYDRVCGMSGTTILVEEELSDIYGLRCASVPTHKPCIRKDLPMQIYKTSDEKDAEIIRQIIYDRDHGQPTLVCSSSLKRAEAIGEKMSEMGIHFNNLNAKTEKSEAQIVAKAGEEKSITVATAIAGRGTDIKPSKDAIENGGLVVLGTDLFKDRRISQQLRGRTGRQGNPGLSILYASLDDALLKFLDETDSSKLAAVIDSIEDGNYNTPAIRSFFEKAQRFQEAYLKHERKETARKDDIIAPYRFEFYRQRNDVLLNANVSDSIISKIITKTRYSNEDVLEHLSHLYIKTKELVRRSTWNNTNRRQVLVPFSADLQPFAIEMDVMSVLSSYEYFCNEYKRQVILQAYDSQWKRFVVYMMGNLDNKEIEQLVKKYDNMMTEIETIITNKILHATILFNGSINEIPSNLEKPENDMRHEIKSPVLRIQPDALCPCNSGKKYCECHGMNIRNINRWKR